MVWEQVARAFWPLAALLAVIFACFWLGLVAALPNMVLPWAVGASLLVVIAAAVWGGLRFSRVGSGAALTRVDEKLPGRPLSALRDHAALGDEGALWQAHQAQMRSRAAAARAVAPDAGLTRRDPFALRLAAMVALAMALIFGGAGNLGDGLSAVAATLRPQIERGDAVATGPSWEGWAEPPAYTRRPTIYLNALPEGEVLELPKGSAVSFRLYGEDATVTQTVGTDPGEDPQAPAFTAMQSGAVEVMGRHFDIIVLPDAAPLIRPGDAPTRRADGRLVQDFFAEDDHGVVSAEAGIALDLQAVDRRFGLAVAPEPREAVALELPLPGGARQEVQGQLVQDLARHPWANLPVTVTLSALDGIDQQGQSAPMQTVLPGRRFFDPLAAALIEMRRDLLWSRENAGRSAEILRAVTWQPDGFVDEILYLQLRASVGVLETTTLSPEDRDKLAEALWLAAIELEDGGLADALERMKQAQEKLSEAIRNGASPDEIQRLMDELKSATDEYMRMLAEQGQPDPADRFTDNQQQGQVITGDQIQQMMDEIQRLMNEGRMAEAQQLLEQFNRMMENMQVTQSQGQGQGQGQSGEQGNQSMNRLADTLREQQGLSDEAFREMQEQFSQGGQQGNEELAQRQQELREQLGQQQGLMPGQGSERGDAARRNLDEAGRAMEQAEQALRDGDMPGAMDRQADAIQSMREGMRALGDMLGEGERRAEGQQQGQEGQQGDQPGGAMRDGQQQGLPYDRRADRDPLGRQLSGNGNTITDGDPLAEGVDPAARARDLQDEIRRRSGERTRPEDERDYLGRLLDRF
ncbi:DUF4175 domain-containing protein [Paracoccus tegillarcae]|uniref:DUF4175 domain-containing protein n=2 Tax=Paracoccus tegillarcae TaxID=1529068 RepID=A0A2K9EJY0_9RHOB|nr:DUF4175 domain-containing protein [Paracoccus tegillarcae]